MPAIPQSVRTAGFILLAIMAYFVFSAVFRSPATETDAVAAPLSEPAERAIPEVLVRQAQTAVRPVFVTLKGSTEPDREVTVRSETLGTVTSARVSEGQAVKAGTLLCGLDVESRAARIAEAEAGVTSARLDYDAARQLEEKGWTTSNNAAAAKAALDRAEAGLSAAKIELGKTSIRAPFDGVFEDRLAERGDFLSMGAACGRVVDLDPIIVAVDATEDQLNLIRRDEAVAVGLSTGQRVEGSIRFISSAASPETRTFRIEIQIPNEDFAIAAGLTATAQIKLGEMPALQTTPASLVLHDDGRIGVRYVDADSIVQFAEVQVIDDASDGIWVTGIQDGLNLLIAGQDYLREGVKVNANLAEGS